MKKIFAIISCILSVGGVLYITNDNPSYDYWSGEAVDSLVKVAESEIDGCLLKSDPGGCLNEVMVSLITRVGPASSWEGYRNVQSRSPQASKNCHVPGHLSGVASFNESRSLTRSLNYLEPVCQGAYIHGVYEAWAHYVRDRDVNVDVGLFKNASKPCAVSISYPGRFYCYEGVGHAVWMLTGDMAKSFEVCGSFTSNDARGGCVEGVVMQRFLPLIDDDVFIAEGVENVSEGCKEFLPSWSMSSSEGEVLLTPYQLCRRSASTLFIMDLGGVVGLDNIESESELFIKRCESLFDEKDFSSKADVSYCLDRAGWAYWYRSDAKLDVGRDLCEKYSVKLEGCIATLKETARENS